MHIHGTHLNPNNQLNALHPAQEAEARRSAERTRKSLLSAASSLAGDDGCVVTLGNQEQAGENPPRGQRRHPENEPSPSGNDRAPFSGYA